MGRILVTGGAGFIGSNLAESLLAEGHKVTVLDDFSTGKMSNIRSHVNNSNFTFEDGSITDQATISNLMERNDKVLHLAAQIHVDKSMKSPKDVFNTNLNGTLNILEAARKKGIEQIVYASSSEVYGSAKTEKINESHELNPGSPYAASKVAADRACFSYNETYGLPVNIVRKFNTFGPRQRNSGYGGAIAIFIKRVLNDEPPIIYGDGTQTRDYMYVKDAVKAYKLILEEGDSLYGEAVNFGTGEDHSIKYIANKIIEICEKDLEPRHVEPRPGEVQKLRADITKAEEQLGFEPEYQFEEALKEYIEWFQGFSNFGW